ncbi:uncharacterized protein LOC143578091 [Bidens hawaiensis]|uniref:uncharacterized protein LOC143578091 n=1 Tax=Bidens hawaiensis TaxID=980011 RepID=UPI004049AAB6
MHLDTIGFLLKANNDKDGTTPFGPLQPDDEIAVLYLLVNAISAKQYSLASELVRNSPDAATKSDEVLMAIAKNCPSGLDYVEALIYPSLDKILEVLINTASLTLLLFGFPLCVLIDFIANRHKPDYEKGTTLLILVVGTIPAMLASPFAFLCFLILTVCFLFLFLYSLWWKGAKIIFGPIKHIENKKKEWDEGKKLLELVCDNIGKLNYSGTCHPYYTRPILEAASQNAYKVVDEILFRSPEAIQSTDKSGYDIIQLAIINHSEKIYNLIYDIGERKNVYRTYKDSSKNNILHLVGKLPPSSVLNERTGAALQVQRELQWREEVKKFVFPTYITQENIFKETPDMVFRREHANLVKEGEQWMKTTAESCSITAALITTIVFAAAITVPGGSDEKDGIPLFRKKISFIIFAISDAISLFASSTALLVFLSILTARFAENDFLVSLPRRLFIGLFSLLLSTIAMMTAFSATLFIVFGDEKLWMLAPICGSAFIPISFFVILQFPLMVDLFRSTSISIFGKQRKSVLRRFNPDEIRLRFGTNFNRSSCRQAAMKEQKNEEPNIQLARGQKKKYFQLRK